MTFNHYSDEREVKKKLQKVSQNLYPAEWADLLGGGTRSQPAGLEPTNLCF